MCFFFGPASTKGTRAGTVLEGSALGLQRVEPTNAIGSVARTLSMGLGLELALEQGRLLVVEPAVAPGDKPGPPKVGRCGTITEGSTAGVEPAAVTGVIKWVTGGGAGTVVTLEDGMRCCQEVGPLSAPGMGLKCQISPYSSIWTGSHLRLLPGCWLSFRQNPFPSHSFHFATSIIKVRRCYNWNLNTHPVHLTCYNIVVTSNVCTIYV